MACTIYLGFVMHMITGAIIGIVYMIASSSKNASMILPLKAFATGVATGM